MVAALSHMFLSCTPTTNLSTTLIPLAVVVSVTFGFGQAQNSLTAHKHGKLEERTTVVCFLLGDMLLPFERALEDFSFSESDSNMGRETPEEDAAAACCARFAAVECFRVRLGIRRC